MSTVAQRYEAIRAQVAAAADCVGRSPDDVTIVGVTKHVGVPEVQAALNAGIEDFGENRVLDFEGKYGLFPEARWHFIGHLQTNKVKDVVGRAALIHSVDSLKLLEFIDRKATEIGVVQPVLVQVNVAAEESKHGFAPALLEDALLEAGQMPGIKVRGLMTMAPYSRPEDVRWVFHELCEVRDSLGANRHDGVELEELSMGMTNDFRVAVEEGSTLVRVGTGLFGR